MCVVSDGVLSAGKCDVCVRVCYSSLSVHNQECNPSDR